MSYPRILGRAMDSDAARDRASVVSVMREVEKMALKVPLMGWK